MFFFALSISFCASTVTVLTLETGAACLLYLDVSDDDVPDEEVGEEAEVVDGDGDEDDDEDEDDDNDDDDDDADSLILCK